MGEIKTFIQINDNEMNHGSAAGSSFNSFGFVVPSKTLENYQKLANEAYCSECVPIVASFEVALIDETPEICGNYLVEGLYVKSRQLVSSASLSLSNLVASTHARSYSLSAIYLHSPLSTSAATQNSTLSITCTLESTEAPVTLQSACETVDIHCSALDNKPLTPLLAMTKTKKKRQPKASARGMTVKIVKKIRRFSGAKIEL